MPPKLRIRHLVLLFFSLQLTAGALFFISGSLIYYAKLYRELPLAKIIPFQLAELLLIVGIETGIFLLVFFRWYNGQRRHIPHLPSLIDQPEHDRLEFKSTLRWDIRNQKISKDLERAVMKTIAAFLNSQGGHLVIGISDDKQAVGLEHDYKTLGKPNSDGFENHFSHIFHNMIGSQYRQYVQLTWHKVDGKECCLVSVLPSSKPVYLRSDEQEEFFIRTGNGTRSMRISQATDYIHTRFRNSWRLF